MHNAAADKNPMKGEKMKLTGELKKKVEGLATKEEIIKAISEAGFELTDEELEYVGGGFIPIAGKSTTIKWNCPGCKATGTAYGWNIGELHLCESCGTALNFSGVYKSSTFR